MNGQNGWDVTSGNVTTPGATVSVTVQTASNGPSAIGTNSVLFNNGSVSSLGDPNNSYTFAAPTASPPLINKHEPGNARRLHQFAGRRPRRPGRQRRGNAGHDCFGFLGLRGLRQFQRSYRRHSALAHLRRRGPNLRLRCQRRVPDRRHARQFRRRRGPASGTYGTYSLTLDYNNGTFVPSFNGVALGTFPLRAGFGYVADPGIFNSGRGADTATLDNFSVAATPSRRPVLPWPSAVWRPSPVADGRTNLPFLIPRRAAKAARRD